MHYRSLGKSGIQVSPLCLGTMMFGGQTDEYKARAITGRARCLTVRWRGPRTLAQWEDYVPALEHRWTAEDETLVDRFVATGHPYLGRLAAA